jgi:hypothetical protein
LEKDALSRIFGYAIIIKYIGFGVFGFSLVAIIIGSLLRFTIPHTTTMLLIGILLIMIGYVAEHFLGAE